MDYEDLSSKVRSRFSISLRSLSQPMSVGDIAKTWDICAREVISEYAQQSGGGSFSSKYGTWENCVTAAWYAFNCIHQEVPFYNVRRRPLLCLAWRSLSLRWGSLVIGCVLDLMLELKYCSILFYLAKTRNKCSSIVFAFGSIGFLLPLTVLNHKIIN